MDERFRVPRGAFRTATMGRLLPIQLRGSHGDAERLKRGGLPVRFRAQKLKSRPFQLLQQNFGWEQQ